MRREAVVGIRTTVSFSDAGAPIVEVPLRPPVILGTEEGDSLGYIYGRVVGVPAVDQTAYQSEINDLMRELEPWFIELRAAIKAALLEAMMA